MKEKLLDGLISLSYVPAKYQLVDVLAKLLNDALHHDIISKLGVRAPANLQVGWRR